MTATIVDELDRIPMSRALGSTLARAAEYASSQAHPEVTLDHLLLALTEDADAEVVLATSKVNVPELKKDVANQLGFIEDRLPLDQEVTTKLSSHVKRILEASAQAAQGRRNEINGAIVLAAIVGDGNSTAANLLRVQGLTFEAAIQALQSSLAAPPADEQTQRPQEPRPLPGSSSAEDFLAQARAKVQSTKTTTVRPITARPKSKKRSPSSEIDDESSSINRTVPPTQESNVEPTARATNQSETTRDKSTKRKSQSAESPRKPSPVPPPPPPLVRAPNTAPPATTTQSAPRSGASLSTGRPTVPTQRPGPSQPPRGPLPAGANPATGRPPQPAPNPNRTQPPGANPPVPPWQSGAEQQRNRPPPNSPAGAGHSPNMAPETTHRPQSNAPPRAIAEAGQLVENIPRTMKVDVPALAEISIARTDVKNLAESLSGPAPSHRHKLMITKAMSVRLRAPDGGFFIETASPETQWIDNNLGIEADDYAIWRWKVTPKTRGRKRLQVIVSARTVGTDGLAAETALPDQVIEVRVKTNFAKSAKHLAGWTTAAVIGGLFSRFGEEIVENGRQLVQAILSAT